MDGQHCPQRLNKQLPTFSKDKVTVLTFTRPASRCPSQAKTEPSCAECPPPDCTAKILVMDDDEMVRTLATKMLAACGHSVATAQDDQEAIALYRQALEAGAPFDLVIMDLTIPGGPSGVEVIKELLVIDPLVKAIVSSGYADDPVMANPAAYGFKDTVAKPYTLGILRKVVANALI